MLMLPLRVIKLLKRYSLLGIFVSAILSSISVVPVTQTVSLVAGRYMNPLLVGFVSALGNVVGEIVFYALGYTGKLLVEDQAWYDTVSGYMQKIVSAIPAPAVNVVATIAGSVNYPIVKYLLASFLGNWLQFTLLAYISYATNYIF
jgi:membrane protein YqaA with SNARE-associated domain